MMSIEIEKPTTRGRWLHIIPATILVYIVAYIQDQYRHWDRRRHG